MDKNANKQFLKILNAYMEASEPKKKKFETDLIYFMAAQNRVEEKPIYNEGRFLT